MMLQWQRREGEDPGDHRKNRGSIRCYVPWADDSPRVAPPHQPSRSRGGPLIAAAPFIAWLEGIADSHTARANITGLRADEVARYLDPKRAPERMRLDIVDQAITCADLIVDGLPFRLEDLYPYDVPLED